MQPDTRKPPVSGGYWPEIDGLRAFAILLVVGFHAGIPQLAGGFVGVDVFFVLSGYLITGLLARELAASGRIDLLEFYARRVRRLLPAMVLVVLATLLAGAFILSPVIEQPNLAMSAIAAIGFMANILFWLTQSSYFAGLSEEIPLLHLWTLSVEEQFYIVWPLIMIATAAMMGKSRQTLRAIAIVLLALTATSFVASLLIQPGRPTLAFYWMPFRAWEFGIGALLALAPIAACPPAFAKRWGSLLTTTGLLAVIGSGLLMDKSWSFPGWATLLPVLGTAAVIAGTRLAPGTDVAKLLASTPLVTLGKLSYSWYLWHWPLLALARANNGAELPLSLSGILVLLALGLSYATYHWVEEPIRRRKFVPFTTAKTSVLVGLNLMVLTAAVAVLAIRVSDRQIIANPMLLAAHRAAETTSPFPAACGVYGFRFDALAPTETCTLGHGSKRPAILLWGDSLAGQLRPGLVEWAKANEIQVLSREFGGCKPYMTAAPANAPLVVREAAKSCVRFNEAVRASLRDLRANGLNAVVIAGRWSVKSQIQTDVSGWADELRSLVRMIREHDLAVILVAETPRLETHIPKCVARRGADACSRPRHIVDSERRDAASHLNSIAAAFGSVTVLDPIGRLCSGTACPALIDGLVMYSDDIHISEAGSRRLSPMFDRILLPIIKGNALPSSHTSVQPLQKLQ